MRSGKLRFPIKFQQDTGVPGSEVATWTDISGMGAWPADIIDVRGVEKFRGQQIEATTTHMVIARWDSRIKPELRIVDEAFNRTFEIVTVLDKMGRQFAVEMQVTELV